MIGTDNGLQPVWCNVFNKMNICQLATIFTHHITSWNHSGPRLMPRSSKSICVFCMHPGWRPPDSKGTVNIWTHNFVHLRLCQIIWWGVFSDIKSALGRFCLENPWMVYTVLIWIMTIYRKHLSHFFLAATPMVTVRCQSLHMCDIITCPYDIQCNVGSYNSLLSC